MCPPQNRPAALVCPRHVSSAAPKKHGLHGRCHSAAGTLSVQPATSAAASSRRRAGGGRLSKASAVGGVTCQRRSAGTQQSCARADGNCCCANEQCPTNAHAWASSLLPAAVFGVPPAPLSSAPPPAAPPPEPPTRNGSLPWSPPPPSRPVQPCMMRSAWRRAVPIWYSNQYLFFERPYRNFRYILIMVPRSMPRSCRLRGLNSRGARGARPHGILERPGFSGSWDWKNNAPY